MTPRLQLAETARSAVAPVVVLDTRASTDPTIKIAADFEAAITEWQRAARAKARAAKRIPEEIRRQPRVQIAFRLKPGTPIQDHDKPGAREPIYAHSDFQIDDDCDRMLAINYSIHGGAPVWVYPNDPDRKPVHRHNAKTRKRRKEIRARMNERRKLKKAELARDRAALAEAQAEAGWTKYVDAEKAAREHCYRLRYRFMSTKPTSLRGATELLQTAARVQRKSAHSENRAPFSLSETYYGSLIRNVGNYLARGRS